MDPEQPVTDVLTMEQIRPWASQRQAMQLAAVAGLAVLLAAVGLYGVLAYSVGQRWLEFGVRIGMLLRHVVARRLTVTAIGPPAGLAVALPFSRLLTAFLSRIQATDPAAYVVVGGILSLTSGLASYLPGRRAMRIDPAVARKQEWVIFDGPATMGELVRRTNESAPVRERW